MNGGATFGPDCALRVIAALVAFLAAGCGNSCAPSQSEESFEIASLPPLRANTPPARIPAKLFMPAASTAPVPAMVIVVSSGCVVEAREPYYARVLAAAGIAGVVVDSCTPRGVRTTVDDQTRLTAWEVENDAWAALIHLARDPRIDPKRIGIMGVSKGGTVSLNTALLVRRRWQRDRVPTEVAFAVHVPIVPGCSAPHRSAETTGAPMLVLLGAADDYTTAAACVPYVDALRAAGNARVAAVTLEGAHHGWESLGEPRLLERAENYSRCHATTEDDGSFVVDGGARLAPEEFIPWARRTCMTLGNTHSGGGTVALKERANAVLLKFLRESGF